MLVKLQYFNYNGLHVASGEYVSSCTEYQCILDEVSSKMNGSDLPNLGIVHEDYIVLVNVEGYKQMLLGI